MPPQLLPRRSDPREVSNVVDMHSDTCRVVVVPAVEPISAAPCEMHAIRLIPLFLAASMEGTEARAKPHAALQRRTSKVARPSPA